MRLFTLCTSALAACALSVGASANTNNNEPGSLLVFPLFENEGGTTTVITVTNTNNDFTPGVGNVPVGTVKVEYIYINGTNCLEFNRTRTLTPNDTISVSTELDNPNMEEGYLYVFAKGAVGPANNAPIKFDYLIGAAVILESEGTAFEYGPYVYKAGNRLGVGGPTDLDGDGRRDLNGFEYEQSPDHILVPRFFGQDPEDVETDLILVNLTGGSQFNAVVDFLIYNDNEEVFSAQYEFECWAEVDLLDINGVFDNEFLKATNHTASEQINLDGNWTETGWYRIDGNVAFSSAASFEDPAILALQVEEIYFDGATELANLPFTTGSQNNGDLLAHSILGDNN